MAFAGRQRLVGHVGPMVAIRHPCRARGPCGRPPRWASPEQQTQFTTALARIPEVDARTDLPGQCDQLRDLVAVVLQAAPIRQHGEAGRLGVASNSLVSAANARRLGWSPKALALAEYLEGLR